MISFDNLATWKLRLMLGAIGVAVVLGGLGGIYAWGSHNSLKAERERMKPVIASYELRIENLLGKLRELQGELDRSNEKVDQLKADADARAVKAAADLRAAKSLADRYRLRASQIAAARPSGDQCEAARDLITTTLKEER